MQMIHAIQTNVKLDMNIQDRIDATVAKVRQIVRRRIDDDVAIEFDRNVENYLIVKIYGNGAALRDAAFALDVEGMLD